MPSERTLYIVRHAKSNWEYENISDIERPLKLKGIHDAYDMARKIKIERHLPGLIISSPAIRALHTADIFLQVLEIKFSKFKIDERLYGSGVGVIRKVISEQNSAINNLMIFGHNPDFSELATLLSGNEFFEIPTCGLVRIKFNSTDWQSISADNVEDSFIDFPKKE